MVRLTGERVLIVADDERQVRTAVNNALPGAQVTSVATMFDALAELSGRSYTAILAAAEPIERRPEAAVRALREVAGDGRIILFGHPTLELLSRKMLEFGCDDYIITPAGEAELRLVFGRPRLRMSAGQATKRDAKPNPTSPPAGDYPAIETELAESLLDALLQHPYAATAAAVAQVNGLLGSSAQVSYAPPGQAVERDAKALSHPVHHGEDELGTLSLRPGATLDSDAARHLASQVARVIGKVAALQDRHVRLQKLAITDDLTGVHNAMYFKHFLKGILSRAKAKRFPVTLLLFDIDDFKKYNDTFGHGVGDQILKQTAALMKACTREHDLVARIGGDEFAVVFWDKEGPRQSHHPNGGISYRPPQTPEQVYDRFKQRIAGAEFPELGSSGKGALGISAGLAVYPYDAHDQASLVEEADRRLMQGAKKSNGKNTLYIVGPKGAEQ